MSKTRIFVSSTCYDLAAAREDLRAHILKLGHEPILSEYPSFPIDPDESAIATCEKNVQKHTDVLLLIVGGSRGSLEPKSGRSITNLEYDVARQHGIPCFVFVSQPVLTLLPAWQKNPKADFTPIVDYAEVFEFVAKIRAENRWMFPFSKTSDIKETLTLQLSTMFRQLLDRERAGTLDPLASYSSESSEAQRLARDKPPYWEFLLTAELLKARIEGLGRQFQRLKAGVLHVPSCLIAGRDFLAWVQAKIGDLRSLIESLRLQMPAIHDAWGELGQPGDAYKIRETVVEFGELCAQLIEWEKDLRGAKPPAHAEPLKKTMEGFTEGIIKELEKLPIELLRPFAGGRKPTGTVEIMLRFASPPMESFNEELRRLQASPPDWLL
jgi:hypothetical protein